MSDMSMLAATGAPTEGLYHVETDTTGLAFTAVVFHLQL